MMSDWNSNMDEAPKDGTRVLLGEASWPEPVIGSWAGWAAEPGWGHSDEDAGITYGRCEPTHWQPLPPSPPPFGRI